MKLIQGDCVEEMKKMEANSIDTIITDPPYHLTSIVERFGKKGSVPAKFGTDGVFARSSKGFMGKEWDGGGIAFDPETWKEMLRVAKPGATLMSFGGTRTYHRMACAIEDAGWQIFDCIFWIYGVGFPKSHNISKALTKEYNGGKMVVYDEKKTKKNIKSPMCGLWKEILHKTWVSQKDYDRGFMQELLEEMDKDTQYKVFTYPRSEGKVSEISEGCEKSRLERWNNIQEKKGKIWECEVCKMPTGFYINGKKRWLCYGASFIDGKETWEMLDENGVCSSYKSQSRGQQIGKLNVICDKCRTQKIREWEGWGSALKPAVEPIVCARKPNEGSYSNNALKYGVAGLNIDGGRIEHNEDLSVKRDGHKLDTNEQGWGFKAVDRDNKGRFPANIILDEEAARMLDEQSGETKTNPMGNNNNAQSTGCFGVGKVTEKAQRADKGGASRFFYVAKASKAERNMGCEGLEEKVAGGMAGTADQTLLTGSGNIRNNKAANNHPTVKPLKLMEYLCLLTKTPTGGVVLDPFMGSGTTGMAAKKTGRDFIGIEKEPEYIKIAEARIKAQAKPLL